MNASKRRDLSDPSRQKKDAKVDTTSGILELLQKQSSLLSNQLKRENQRWQSYLMHNNTRKWPKLKEEEF